MSTVLSHRQTTSSRTPGRINHGTVRVLGSGLQVCADCGRPWTSLGVQGDHSPHYREIDGQHRIVNCIGRVLR